MTLAGDKTLGSAMPRFIIALAAMTIQIWMMGRFKQVWLGGTKFWETSTAPRKPCFLKRTF